MTDSNSVRGVVAQNLHKNICLHACTCTLNLVLDDSLAKCSLKKHSSWGMCRAWIEYIWQNGLISLWCWDLILLFHIWAFKQVLRPQPPTSRLHAIVRCLLTLTLAGRVRCSIFMFKLKSCLNFSLMFFFVPK